MIFYFSLILERHKPAIFLIYYRDIWSHIYVFYVKRELLPKQTHLNARPVAFDVVRLSDRKSRA